LKDFHPQGRWEGLGEGEGDRLASGEELAHWLGELNSWLFALPDRWEVENETFPSGWSSMVMEYRAR